MEVHRKIKPLHGWREFIGEVGIIVFGVLIALGAEQVAQRIHWNHQVEVGREAVSGDFAQVFAMAKERELYSKCIARRLRDIAAILDEASKTGRLPPVGELGSPSHRDYSSPSWTSLNGGGVAAHFSRKDMFNYGGIAAYGPILTETNLAEFTLWSRLYAIVGPGRPIGEAEEGELRAALSEAGYRAKLMRIGAYQIREMMKSAGVKFDEEFARAWPADYAEVRKKVAARPVCRPLGKAPDQYGQSPFFYSLEGPIDS